MESKEKEEEQSPSPPPIGQRTMSMLSDAPPEIPVRTEASYHLIEEVPDEVESAEYKEVRADEENFVGGTADYELISTGPVVKDVPGSTYEAPTPCKELVLHV